MNIRRLEETLRRHEGYSAKPYKDSEGILTIGVGRNLEDRGLSVSEVSFLLLNDIALAKNECHKNVRGFRELNGPRQEVVVNMAFNLGLPRLLLFKKFLQALYVQDYDTAAVEMLDSKWARQVGYRAQELARVMERGVWQYGI